jgi:hypothetical protein
MAVVIDELAVETVGQGAQPAPAASGGGAVGPGQGGQIDMDLLASEIQRRLHRAARLWAD